MRPGKLTAHGYTPPTSRQVIATKPGSIKVIINVPHAKHFHRHRRIIPTGQNMKAWTRDAVKAGRDNLLLALKEEL